MAALPDNLSQIREAIEECLTSGGPTLRSSRGKVDEIISIIQRSVSRVGSSDHGGSLGMTGVGISGTGPSPSSSPNHSTSPSPSPLHKSITRHLYHYGRIFS